MIGELLTWLAAAVLVLSAATLGTTAVALWRMRRRNRVHPKVPSAAPLLWLVSPGRAGRLHRRLRTTVAVAMGTRPGAAPHHDEDAVADLVVTLVQEAVIVDGMLVTAARAPLTARRRLLDDVAASVGQVESLSRRLAALRADPRGSTPPGAALRALEERVDVLEAARIEVAELEGILRFTGGPTVSRPLPPR